MAVAAATTQGGGDMMQLAVTQPPLLGSKLNRYKIEEKRVFIMDGKSKVVVRFI